MKAFCLVVLSKVLCQTREHPCTLRVSINTRPSASLIQWVNLISQQPKINADILCMTSVNRQFGLGEDTTPPHRIRNNSKQRLAFCIDIWDQELSRRSGQECPLVMTSQTRTIIQLLSNKIYETVLFENYFSTITLYKTRVFCSTTCV